MAHVGLIGHFVGVNDVELQVLFDQVFLHFRWQVVPNFIRPINAVEQENTIGTGIFEHVVLLEEAELMAGQEVGFVLRYQVGRLDGLRSKPEVRNCHRTRFLGVILEVTLGVVVSLFTDDLDRVLIRSHCAVCTQAKEHRLDYVITQNLKGWVPSQVGVGDIVNNANGEVVLGRFFIQFVIHAFDHGGGELFGRKPVAAADDLRHGLKRCNPLIHTLFDGIDNVQVQRLATGAGLFRAVQYSDCPHRAG